MEPQVLSSGLRKLRGSRMVVLRMRFSRSSGTWWGVPGFFKIKREVFLRAFSIKNNFHEFKTHHDKDQSQNILRHWGHTEFLSIPS